MGGHGGLNILPQKKWNVYNYENREKVRKDEEAAAREEQLKREQSRRRDSEFRIEKLRQARNLPPSSSSSSTPDPTPSSDSRHINLFDNLHDFSSLGGEEKFRKEEENDGGSKSVKKRKREEGPTPVVVTPEDEKYKLGYGLAGKGVKAPWYLSRPAFLGAEEDRSSASSNLSGKKSGGKKSIEELREERVRREKKEKERELALLVSKKGVDKGFSRRRM